MNGSSIAQIIAELDQSIRDMQTEAARSGKGQALAQLRLERRQGALEIVTWCRDNSELVRAVKAQKGEQE